MKVVEANGPDAPKVKKPKTEATLKTKTFKLAAQSATFNQTTVSSI